MSYQNYSSACARSNSTVMAAKATGLLPRIKPGDQCVSCGRQATEYDHRDLDRPLWVEMVCHSCNLRRGPAYWTHQVTGIRYLGHWPLEDWPQGRVAKLQSVAARRYGEEVPCQG